MQIFGARDYAMRIWLDPDKVAARDLTAGEVVAALQAQNVQVSAGVLGQPPVADGRAPSSSTSRRWAGSTDPSSSPTSSSRSDAQGRVTRVRDIGRVELGAQDYSANAYLDRHERGADPGLPAARLQRARDRDSASSATMDDAVEGISARAALRHRLQPDDVHRAVGRRGAARRSSRRSCLVVVVVILFLQTWRASIIPIVAIPVSLIGTFAVLAALGFSLNNLSLFGLVLAVGIVVDDAIVVVENVERNLRQGMSPREAAHRTMDEVGGALIAIALTLCAVFIPSAFITRHLGPVLPPVRGDDRGLDGDLAASSR